MVVPLSPAVAEQRADSGDTKSPGAELVKCAVDLCGRADRAQVPSAKHGANLKRERLGNLGDSVYGQQGAQDTPSRRIGDELHAG